MIELSDQRTLVVFQFLSLSYVLANDENHGPSIRIAHSPSCLSHPQNGPVPANLANFSFGQCRGIASTQPQPLLCNFVVLVVDNLQQRLPYQFRSSVTQRLRPKLIDGQDRAISIYREVHRRVVFIERTVPHFTLLEQVLHLLPVCDVDTDANDPFWLAIISVGNEASLLDPSKLTARTNN